MAEAKKGTKTPRDPVSEALSGAETAQVLSHDTGLVLLHTVVIFNLCDHDLYFLDAKSSLHAHLLQVPMDVVPSMSGSVVCSQVLLPKYLDRSHVRLVFGIESDCDLVWFLFWF